MKKVLYLILFLLFIVSCQKGEMDTNLNLNQQKFDTLKNEYAEAFQIIYQQNDIKINIIEPTTKDVVESYFINKLGDVDGYNVFDFDIERIVTTSTTHVGMLHKLGLEDLIVGVSSYKYLCHPLTQKKVREVGEMGYTNPEAFVAANPDIIFYSGYDLNDPLLEKFEQAGLKSFLIYEWKETHPLGRAEWLKLYGILFQKEKESNALYNEIVSKYKRLSNKLKRADKQVSMFAGTPVGDIFNAPAGESYMGQLFKDANINYVYGNTLGTGSLNLTMEEVISQNKDTEYWLNVNARNKKEVLAISPRFEMLKSTKTKKIYSYVENGDCFWEDSPVAPYLILEDLGKIFHPELFDNHELNYYSRIK